MEWAFHELLDSDLGDVRRTDRLIAMVEALSRRPEASPLVALGDPHQAKAAYRFWDSEPCTVAGILSGHVRRTHQRCAACDEVLVVQDSTEFNYTSHRAASGLGYTSRPKTQGVKGHAALAVAPDGDVLGVLDLFLWTRPNGRRGQAPHRNQRTTDQKESARWLRGVRAAAQALPPGGRVVVVGDAEADMFDLFAAARAPGVELLVRVCRKQRLVNHPQRSVLNAVLSQPVGSVNVEIPRADGRPGRHAALLLYATGAAVPPPQNHPRKGCAPLMLHWVLAREESPPQGATPVEWLLATTLRIASYDEAVACLDRYRLRWRIERFFYALKQGCAVEKLELQKVERLQRALATYAIVAWRLVHLLYQARAHPDADGRTLFHPAELHLLQIGGSRRAPISRDEPITNAQAVQWLGRLGGHPGRARDAPPGVKSLWRGLRRLTDQLQGYLMAQAHLLNVGNA
jgi:Transposase DNA-binding/Transposase Tn5 dimerisation domain